MLSDKGSNPLTYFCPSPTWEAYKPISLTKLLELRRAFIQENDMLYMVFRRDKLDCGYGLGDFVSVWNRERDADEVARKRQDVVGSNSRWNFYVVAVRADRENEGQRLIQENINSQLQSV